VLDTSSFTHEDHARRSVFNSVDQTLGGALGGSIACAAPADESAPLTPQQCARRGVWAAAIGGYTDIDATRSAFAAEQTLVGGLAGAHFDAAPGITAGLFGGFAETDLSTEYDAEHVETSFAIAGAFARLRKDQGFADLSVTGLWSDSDRRRDIASNIGGTDHFEAVTASANGWLISPAMTLGLRLPVAAETMLVPAVKLRGTIGQSGGYSETGAFSAISIGARDIADLDSRIEVSVHKSFAVSESLSGVVRATAGVSYFGIFGDRTFHGPVRGIEGSTSTVNEISEFGGYAGLGLDVPLSDTASLFADTEMHLTDRAQSISGFGGVKVRF
ncbi:MAG: autotransporter outer membrane beta-barrel domain-containing protein, partial [Hyphomicrobium sp.]